VREQHGTAVEVAADERLRFEEELDLRQQEILSLEGRIAELERRAQTLGSQVSARDEIVAAKEGRLNELQSELKKLESELEQRAAELDERERKLREVQEAWQQATGQVESQRSRLAAHMGSFHAAQEMLAQLKPMLQELETRLTTDDDDDDDNPTVIVSDELSEQSEVFVNDGSSRGWRRKLDRSPPRKATLDELPPALPSQSPDLVEEGERAGFDLSMLDEDDR
jgi:chromosome segregation ATPase